MKRKISNLLVSLLVMFMLCNIMCMHVFADGTVNPVTGISVTASGATNGPSLSGTTVTVTKQGGLFNSGEATIKVTNTSSVKAKITFSYEHSGDGSLGIMRPASPTP